MSALSPARIGWYARRATRMSPAEMAWRTRDQALRAAWSRRQVRREEIPAILPRSGGSGGSPLSCRRARRSECPRTPERPSWRLRISS